MILIEKVGLYNGLDEDISSIYRIFMDYEEEDDI